MRSKGGKKQSKLINHVLRAPITVLRKARDFYVDNLICCAGKMGKGGGGIVGFTVPRTSTTHHHLRRSFSTCSSSENWRSDDDDEDLKLLLRAALAEIDMNRNAFVRKKGSKGVDRSYSVRVGRIGRIDENEPCDFMEVDASTFVYPRCTSYAAVK